ncbi:MAG TPA: porin [Thermoanaerobaculia bacterium]|nr:porin [Thermoanaerobaculia bacterium]
MKRQSVGRFIAAAALVAVLLPAAASAQAIIKVNDDVWFRFGMQLQGWADWLQSATTRGYAENLYLRRDRFQVAGSVAPGVTFFFQTDQPNLGKAPKAFGTGFVVQDAWGQWALNEGFAINFGKFIVPFSRNELQSTVSFLTLDISPTSTVFLTPTATDATRDTGFELKGYLIDGGRLEYRYALMQGVRTADSRNGFRNSAYVQYDFLETERGYVYAGTNLGKKNIFALSGGYDGQAGYHAYSADAFTNLKVGAGDEFGGQFQWTHYDGEHSIITLPRQNDYLVELAYFISAAKFQPFGKWEKQSFSAGDMQKNDVTRWGAGAHYYVYGQNLKLSAQYLRIIPKSPIKDTNEFTVAMQVYYF